MDLEGRKIIVNKSLHELKQMLERPEDYRQLMPDALKNFEVIDGGFNFELSGFPKIGLKITDISDQQIVLSSAKESLDFTLRSLLNPLSTAQTEVQLLFQGKFNPFISMMAQKPLQNFINSLTDKLEQL